MSLSEHEQYRASGNLPSKPSPFDMGPTKIIYLRHCEVRFYPEGCVRTIFHDGSHFEGWPHYVDDYFQIAKRCGYHIPFQARTACENYCQEHDFCHNFLAQELKPLGISTVIWPMAHKAPVPRYEGLCEESLVMMFQRWLRADERPILDGPNWIDLKDRALIHLTVIDGR